MTGSQGNKLTLQHWYFTDQYELVSLVGVLAQITQYVQNVSGGFGHGSAKHLTRSDKCSNCDKNTVLVFYDEDRPTKPFSSLSSI